MYLNWIDCWKIERKLKENWKRPAATVRSADKAILGIKGATVRLADRRPHRPHRPYRALKAPPFVQLSGPYQALKALPFARWKACEAWKDHKRPLKPPPFAQLTTTRRVKMIKKDYLWHGKASLEVISDKSEGVFFPMHAIPWFKRKTERSKERPKERATSPKSP